MNSGQAAGMRKVGVARLIESFLTLTLRPSLKSLTGSLDGGDMASGSLERLRMTDRQSLEGQTGLEASPPLEGTYPKNHAHYSYLYSPIITKQSEEQAWLGGGWGHRMSGDGWVRQGE